MLLKADAGLLTRVRGGSLSKHDCPREAWSQVDKGTKFEGYRTSCCITTTSSVFTEMLHADLS